MLSQKTHKGESHWVNVEEARSDFCLIESGKQFTAVATKKLADLSYWSYFWKRKWMCLSSYAYQRSKFEFSSWTLTLTTEIIDMTSLLFRSIQGLRLHLTYRQSSRKYQPEVLLHDLTTSVASTGLNTLMNPSLTVDS